MKAARRANHFALSEVTLGLCQAFAAKIFYFRFSEICGYLRAFRADYEGRFAVVTSVGCGMRWTLRHRLTSEAKADGEIVRSRSPDAGIKSCVANAGRRWPEARRTEETTYKP